MRTPSFRLLLHFRKCDTQLGVTRETLKALAERLGLSEAEVVHIALSRLASEELWGYALDEGPLTAQDLCDLRRSAAALLPKGTILKKQSLFSSS